MVGSCREKGGGGGVINIKKGPWTSQEDNLLFSYIQQHGHGSWQSLPSKAGLKRCGKSCRLRWSNYLRPDIKRGKFSVHEEHTIIQLHALLGNKWSAIASHLPKRTDNEIKNYWNTHLKKRLEKMGIDPTNHKPKTMNNNSSFGLSPNLSHIAQWESARLEAEARLVRQTSSFAFSNSSSLLFPHPSTTLNARPPRPKCLDVLKAWQGMVFGLESPNSIFNFPHNNNNNNPNPVMQYSGNSSNNVFVPGKSSIETSKQQIDHDHEQVQVQETMLLDDEHGLINGNGNEYNNVNDALILNSSESEELAGMVGSDQNGSNNFINVVEDNNGNYWNSLLSLVDEPLSPFFL